MNRVLQMTALLFWTVGTVLALCAAGFMAVGSFVAGART